MKNTRSRITSPSPKSDIFLTMPVCPQTPFGPSSFAELLSAPYSEDASVSLPEDLDPFQEVTLEPAPLPSFQETYGFKMDDECYNVAAPAPAPTPYHIPHPSHTPHPPQVRLHPSKQLYLNLMKLYYIFKIWSNFVSSFYQTNY